MKCVLQVQQCEENFVKTCYIEYDKRAIQEVIKVIRPRSMESDYIQMMKYQVCRNTLIKDCISSGPDLCRTIYQSECWTKQEKHEVEDDVPSCQRLTETSCDSQECKEWPRQVCQVGGSRGSLVNTYLAYA